MSHAVRRIVPLDFVWETQDPFLFCVHHLDHYPAGNEGMGPATPLAGRNLGSDFAVKDGFRMYHGREVPGFPQHPHCGFETVTLVRQGFVDHSDSLGATARLGPGDVQWMTAGRGIVHSEMFPLVRRDAPNPVELFQLWLNLPATAKDARPHFEMMWREDVPVLDVVDPGGRHVRLTVVAGDSARLIDTPAAASTAPVPRPPPASYASEPTADIEIVRIELEPLATWRLPQARIGTRRMLYGVRGTTTEIEDMQLPERHAAELAEGRGVSVHAGAEGAELLLLGGRPLGEPVASYGPFVAATRTGILEAIRTYEATQFGGWPWPTHEPVHARQTGRFAQLADGRRVEPPR